MYASQTLPDNSTWYVMSHAPVLKFHEIGNQYGFRTSVEDGLKQSKDELGWADFRMTRCEQIEKWWELVMSVFLMVSLFARLIIRPLICFNWLKQWLEVFDIPQLAFEFALFIEQMNQFVCPIVHRLNLSRLIFSSA